jgi:hypothetical protein
MTTAEPMLPHPEDDESIAAANPGAGAPEPVAGSGTAGEEPDRAENMPGADADATASDTPFRTPVPPTS